MNILLIGGPHDGVLFKDEGAATLRMPTPAPISEVLNPGVASTTIRHEVYRRVRLKLIEAAEPRDYYVHHALTDKQALHKAELWRQEGRS